ncbi:adhesion G protein-coupled receptor G3 [Tachyglossus aculeatus]|uniref:adhesion G protein-coupled receptor G3 n=1 Tax=Tachyglossus aculeatus TaxID=9261 RepID=UPI0018F306DE|nr:adhesion G protein-coupled receptor G3 [Tachyglossus aculeatus]
MMTVLLFLLQLASSTPTTSPEENLGSSPSSCSSISQLRDTPEIKVETCFSSCQGKTEKCEVGEIQRYWIKFENQTQEKIVNATMVKALFQTINITNTQDLYFSLIPHQVPGLILGAVEESPDRVRIPRTLLETLRANTDRVQVAISVFDIGRGNLFKGQASASGDGTMVLDNRMVGIRVGRQPITDLTEPVEITFSHRKQPQNLSRRCVFWNPSQGKTGNWDSRGCSSKLRDLETVCFCDHLTFFALLLEPTLDIATVWALTRISQAGCSTSIIFLTLTILLYFTLRFTRKKFKQEDPPKIHTSLSSSLCLLNVTFLIALGTGAPRSDRWCWALGGISHYFLLSSFTWMGIEAFHLYLLVIKIFKTYFRHYFLKLCLVGWGIPAFVVFITGVTGSYGRFLIKNQKNQTTLELCWIKISPAWYITTHGYFSVIFSFNLVILCLVSWKIFSLQSSTAGKERSQAWKGVLTVLGLSCLVGSTWALVFLTPLGPVTAYIFTLFNSLQGIFIFCWFTALYFLGKKAETSSSATAKGDKVTSMSRD